MEVSVVVEEGERVLGSVIVWRSVPLLVRLRLPIGVGLVDGVAWLIGGKKGSYDGGGVCILPCIVE